MARPQAFERELRLATAFLDPQNISRELAAFARQSLAQVQASGQASQFYEKSVNGRRGAAEETVVPPGPIVYDFSYLPEIAEFALEFARNRSPVDSGRYKGSWFVLVNGETVPDLSAIPDDAELVITNDQPYHRKIDVGAMKMRVPPGIVEDTRQAVMRRFGNVIRAERRFVNLASGRGDTEVPYILRRGSQRKGRTDKDRRAGAEMTYPALVITHRF